MDILYRGGENLRKKWLALITVLLVVLTSGSFVWAQGADIIYRESSVEPVAPGVTYETTWQFTPAGWLKLHVIRADITKATVDTDLLLSAKGLNVTERLSEMAAGAGAVAAINGDFFFGRGSGAPLGLVVKDKEMLSTPSPRKDLAVFGLRPDGSAAVGSFSFQGQVTAGDGMSFPLAAWNKPGDSYSELYGFDASWGTTTPTNVPEGSLAAIIRNGMVSELVPAAGGVTIVPETQILVGAGAAADFINSYLTPGKQIEVSVSTEPSWQEFAWALGGGSVLIKDGKIVPFTHEVKGASPRSAVGVTSDGRQLILAAVDGRQEESKGLTQAEWAALLLKIGTYQALNLDGGGSTTVLARLPGENSSMIVNKPSDIRERPISNGIGVFSRAPQGELAGLVVSTADTHLVPNGTRLFTVKGYDINYNPVPVDETKINWRVEPASLGTMQGNMLTASSSGKGTVVASYGSVEGKLDIEVIGPTVRLDIAPKQLVLAPNTEAVLTVYAYDSIGRKALLRAEDLTWQVLGEIGTVQDGKIKAGPAAAVGAVEAQWGQVAARSLVTTGTQDIPLLYFEALHGISSAVYPAEVKGNISLAQMPEPVYDRNHSLRLDYDFTGGSGTKAAYVVFDLGLALPGQADALSLMVHGDGQGHWLRALLVDKNGREFTVDLARQVDWTGWRKLDAKLPTGAYPYTLKRIYLVEPDASKQGTGTIYLDNLALTSPLPFDEELALAPKPFPDTEYTGAAIAGGTKFLVMSSLPEQPENLKWVAPLKTAIQENKVAYLVCLNPLSQPTKEVWEEALGLPIKTVGVSNRWDEDTAVLYTLNAAGGTLVQGNAKDWLWLQEDLAGLTDKKQIFVFLERQPFVSEEGFSSRPEADLLRRRLRETGERLDALVWTFSPSSASGVNWEDGVRYQRLQRLAADEAPRLALVTIKDGKATYTGLKY